MSGSFIEGFRTPATVKAASLQSAGIRNPQHERTLAPWLSSDRKGYGNLGEYN
jgi:hypothetical protein